MHLTHDVTTSDELLLDVDLRDCWPVRVLLNRLSDLVILKHVDIFKLHTVGVKQHNDISAEPTLRLLLCALHEHNNIVGIYPFGESLF